MSLPSHFAPCLEVGEAQFRAVLDAIPARVALLDRERRHCYANREYAAFVDRRPEELLGHTVPELLGAEAYSRLAHLYGSDQRLEISACEPSGTRIRLEIPYRPALEPALEVGG